MTRQRIRRASLAAAIIAVPQALLGIRVLWRLLRTGMRAAVIPESGRAGTARVAVIVPVLNEADRLSPCLEGLTTQDSEVSQILVVDGGSVDGTQELVRSFASHDSRIRLIDASPIPDDWNGKAWGLQCGLEATDASILWILTIDADVRPRQALTRSLLDFARMRRLAMLSVATRQEIETLGEGLVHPSFLTTLVYRFGIPGNITHDPSNVQANGQCFLIRRELLQHVGEFAAVRGSICEDVTLARIVAASGEPVGFFEAGDLVSARMYSNGWSTLREWPRSLPMRDQFFGLADLLHLLEIVTVQSAPLPLLVLARVLGLPGWFATLQAILVITRAGVLVGIRRAYPRRPWTFWASPLFDMPATMLVMASTLRRRFTWRGRALARGGTP